MFMNKMKKLKKNEIKTEKVEKRPSVKLHWVRFPSENVQNKLVLDTGNESRLYSPHNA